MTTDLNDRLKLVSEQGVGGTGYMGCLSVCVLKKQILLPDQKQNDIGSQLGASVAYVATYNLGPVPKQ